MVSLNLPKILTSDFVFLSINHLAIVTATNWLFTMHLIDSKFTTILNTGGHKQMYMIWMFGSISAIFGAIAGSFFDQIPLSAIAFSLIAIVFLLAAYKEISGKKEQKPGSK